MSAILVDDAGPVVIVTLNRPERRNAFDEQLIAELSAWASAPLPATARAAVLRGAGKSFCAGADVRWMSRTLGYSHDEHVRDSAGMAAMFQALDTLPIPLIGRVHGAALGGGAGLAAVCDIVVAAEDAIFGFTEAKLGIVPAVISPFAVAKIGPSAARELFLTGRRFSAAHAQAISLVHAVAVEAELDAVVGGYVAELMTSAPSAMPIAKRLIAAVAGRQPGEVTQMTVDTIATCLASSEGQRGMRAFLAKQPAPWTPADR